MGNCQYCNKPAGIFKKKHKECETLNSNGFNEIMHIYEKYKNRFDKEIDNEEMDRVYTQVRSICNKSYIDDLSLSSKYNLRIKFVIDDIIENGNMTNLQEINIKKLLVMFTNTSLECFYHDEVFSNLYKAITLREIDENKYPDYSSLKDELPINLLKDEIIIWPFWNISFYDTKIKRVYQGSSQGVSIRLAKGLSYRVGAFKGKPIDTENIELIDMGNLIVTNMNLYFCGNKKSFKIKFSDILSFIDFEEGLGIQEDSINKTPKIFDTKDKKFAYKLIKKVASI